MRTWFKQSPWSLPLALLTPVLFLALLGNQAGSREPEWWTTHALVKIRPEDIPPTNRLRKAELAAARNEFEPFQIVLRPVGRDLEDVDAESTDLRGPGAAVIDKQNVRVYLERYVVLRHTLSGGASAEWPDPLIPRVDQYVGERRNGFPFRVAAGRNQPMWVDVYVPPDTPRGDYQGQVRITAKGVRDISVPIRLHVWGFTLPSTSNFKTSFGFSGPMTLKQHRGKYTNDEDLQAITYLYAKAALWHRISINGGTFLPPEIIQGHNGMRVIWTTYDKEVAPFLDGTVFAKDEPLYGAKATSIDLRTNNDADTDAKRLEYWRQWVRHFEEKGWLDRLFLYVRDEPSRTDFPNVAARARLAHQADPRLRTLVTASYNQALGDSIDIWAPLMNCMVMKLEFPDYCDEAVPRQAYNAAIQMGKDLWWYQSCASHGCKDSGGEYFRGWPNYLIDGSAVANRIMPWISWKYNVSGELYYSVAEASDAWNNIYLYGGNGEGTLFYPGRPDRIGGHTDIPIESIRLKLIREGLEDYEYLALLSAQGRSQWVNELVSGLVQTAYDWQQDPQALYAVRKELGEALDSAAQVDSQ
jgi:Glycoside hydrolase 123, catalytic domain/Glycoside hydrolase 123 N-terminal domain